MSLIQVSASVLLIALAFGYGGANPLLESSIPGECVPFGQQCTYNGAECCFAPVMGCTLDEPQQVCKPFPQMTRPLRQYVSSYLDNNPTIANDQGVQSAVSNLRTVLQANNITRASVQSALRGPAGAGLANALRSSSGSPTNSLAQALASAAAAAANGNLPPGIASTLANTLAARNPAVASAVSNVAAAVRAAAPRTTARTTARPAARAGGPTTTRRAAATTARTTRRATTTRRPAARG